MAINEPNNGYWIVWIVLTGSLFQGLCTHDLLEIARVDYNFDVTKCQPLCFFMSSRDSDLLASLPHLVVGQYSSSPFHNYSSTLHTHILAIWESGSVEPTAFRK